VAREAGARVVMLNTKLAQGSGADAYLASTEANVAALSQALRCGDGLRSARRAPAAASPS